ncbi:MAG: Xaa-Pro peptidase family protein [Pseudomonadota bacterium]
MSVPDEPARGFDRAEFAERTARAQALMAAAELDGLLLTTQPEIRYFTGFQTAFWHSPTRPWFLYVPETGKPLAVIPEIGAALMRQTWIEDIRTWPAPRPTDDGVGLLIDMLSPLAKRRGRLGVPKGPETMLRMPLGDYERLLAALPGLVIDDATAIIRALRMVKSPAEIAKLSHIGAVASKAFAEVPSLLIPGMTPVGMFRAFRQTALAMGADEVPFLVGGAGQDGYRDVISPPVPKPVAPGDILMMDTGCTWDGYFCDFDRNFAIARASDAPRRAYEVLWRATEAGLEAARPGVTCRQVFGAMQREIATVDPAGGDIGRLGHGLGMQLTEWPSLARWDETELCENMVLTLEPSLGYQDGLMMVHEENIVVQQGAPRLLTRRAPPELPVI